MAIGDLSDSPSYSQLLEAMRAGQVEQLVLLPNQDLVQVQFKDGKTSKVNIFPNDQEVLRTAEAHNVPLDVRNSQGEAAMTGLAGQWLVGGDGAGAVGLALPALRQRCSESVGLWPHPSAGATGRIRGRAL